MRRIQPAKFLATLILALALTASHQNSLSAQTPTGSIEGIITDPSGAAIPNAKITITQAIRGRIITTTTDSEGSYAVSALEPGDYIAKIEFARFKTAVLELHVDVGKAANGSVTLELGEALQTLRVNASEETQVDVNRNTIGGTITLQQMQDLPVDGRNFLELADLEPGVQVVDAESLEVTKTGFTAISIAGSEGRTTRIQVDGVDITDEVVGTTTQNISMDAIGGFQISQFTLDPSTSLSNTGAVNIVTRSGSNEFHGSLYAYWRDHNFASRILGLDAPFHRVQGGVRLGGPIQSDRVFFFVNYEQIAQHNAVFLAPPAPFSQFTGFVATPFPAHMGTARVDWNASSRIKVFARYTHDDSQGVTAFGGKLLSPLANKNNTNSEVVGTDVSLGRVTHSLRYGHLNFADYLDPATPPGIPQFPVQIVFDDTGTTFGPNFMGHEHSLQTNDQVRYDGSYVFPRHVLQYGVNYSHIVANLFGAVFSVAPLVDTATNALVGPDPTNPLDYTPVDIIFGNGLGFFSAKPSRGFPLGGIRNNRIALYIADSYKTKPHFTLNFGLRWEVDPGHVNHDLVRPALLDTVRPNQSGRESIAYKNFGPSFGFAWNIAGRNSTVIRAGGGIYYETNIFENVLFDRANFLPINVAPQFPVVSTPPLNQLFGPTGDVIFDFNSVLGQPLAATFNQILSAETQFQAETQANLNAPSNGFIAIAPPNRLPGTQNTMESVFDRKIAPPYSLQTNIGVQHRFGKNWLAQADFVRNRGVHIYMVQDVNHFGAANTLNLANAQAAILMTLGACGVGSIDQAIASCPGLHPAGGGATIFDFALLGLDRGFAFPGNNPNFGTLQMVQTEGLSSYRALQIKITGHADKVAHFIRAASWGFSYALSRFEATQADQANSLHAFALDNNCATCLFGPIAGDRTHQLAVNTLLTLPFGLQWNTVTHLSSPLPVTLQLNRVSPFGIAEIFFSDINGDGTGGDVLPGTNIGSFGRSIQGVSGLNNAITNFNNNFAGQFTPAANALVAAGLFTPTQLQALGALIPPVPLAPPGQVTPAWFWTTDFRLSKTFTIKERAHVETIFDAFNVFNRVNFDPIDNLLSGTLSGQPGTVNGTTPGLRRNVFGLGTGAFSPGIPRALQFALRVTF